MPPKKKKIEKKIPVERNENFNIGILLFIFFILIVIAAFAWAFLNQNKTEKNKEQSVLMTEEGTDRVLEDILNKLKTHLILPEGEKPMIATINDAVGLANEQPFYKDARNGDKLVIFSKKAIIYRPDDDVIVNVGPVLLQGDLSSEINQETIMLEVVDLTNGSEEFEQLMKSLGELKNLESLENEDNKDIDLQIEQSLLINMTGANIEILEDFLGITAEENITLEDFSSEADAVLFFVIDKI